MRAMFACTKVTEAHRCCCTALGLEKRFANTHALLCLHVWMTLVRLREEGKNGKDLAQMLYENFQDNVEHRVHAEGVKVRLHETGTGMCRRLQGGNGVCMSVHV